MMRKIWLGVLVVMIPVMVSCTSAPTSEDDDLAAADAEGSVKTTDDFDKTDVADNSDKKVDESEPMLDEGLDDDATKSAPDNTAMAPEAPPTPVPQSPSASTNEAQSATSNSAETLPSQSVEITNIGYMANNNGGTVLIETSSPAQFSKRLNPENQQFVIEIIGGHLPDRLKRPYILKEFGGLFGAINAYQAAGSGSARIVIQLKGTKGVEPIVQQEGGQLLVMSPSAATDVEEAAAPVPNGMSARKEKSLSATNIDEFLQGNQKFYGSEISIQTKDADVRDVLDFIADQSGANMIISDDVQGKISIKLRRVPWDQALMTVMKAKRLGYVRQGEVLRIASLAELKNESESARQIVESQKSLEPLKIKIIPVNYANMDELVANLTKLVTKGRGTVAQDRQSSSLIITDTEDVLERLNALVKDLDVPTPQVMIEGKIIEATNQFQQNIGINWSLGGTPTQISNAGGVSGSPINLTPHLSVQPLDSTTASAAPFALNVNIGTLNVIGNINALLSLQELDSYAKVLSSPRVVTMNRQAAKISQTTENLTLTNTITGTTITQTVTRTPVKLELTVTPQITADGSVIMDITVQRDFLGAVVSQQTGAAPINSRQAATKILVRSGQTAVIGGIYVNDNTVADSGVPMLKDVPVLGWLFKTRNTQIDKNELLMFLTPRILASTRDLETHAPATSIAK
jgi:type IV pilus assembly protein PilQ